MKKVFALFLSIMLFISCAAIGTGFAESKKINIVTTIFPIYDWVREIVGGDAEHVDITLLLDNGVDLHSYQPTAADIMKISVCDLFVYVGGESDEWVEDALQEATNQDMEVINLLGELGDAVKEEEVVEGMQEEEHDHDHDEDHDEDHEEDYDHDHEEETEYDEHVWLSLRNAAVLVSSISYALQQIDGQHAADYQANAKAYIEKLNALDAQYRAAVEGAANRTVLFGDRFPFRYLADDYGLDYYAAFSGCSAESEASFATIIFLAQKVDELGLPAVLTIENPKTKIAETVVQSTTAKNQKILSLDSLQGTTAQDIQSGKTYLSVMEANLNVLKEALN